MAATFTSDSLEKNKRVKLVLIGANFILFFFFWFTLWILNWFSLLFLCLFGFINILLYFIFFFSFFSFSIFIFIFFIPPHFFMSCSARKPKFHSFILPFLCDSFLRASIHLNCVVLSFILSSWSADRSTLIETNKAVWVNK